MQDSEETNLSSKILRVCSYYSNRLGCSPKQDFIDHTLVLICDPRYLFWYREDDMEILCVQQLCLTVFQPLGAGEGLALGAMPVTA